MFALDFIQIHNSSVRIKRIFALNHSKAPPPPPLPLQIVNPISVFPRASLLTWTT